MNSIILLGTYVGPSDFVFEVTCTGRRLEKSEVLEKRLATDDVFRRHHSSAYMQGWYEVKEGDHVRVCWHDDEHKLESVFVIPAELRDPPQSLDDPRTGMWVYQYLRERCIQIS